MCVGGGGEGEGGGYYSRSRYGLVPSNRWDILTTNQYQYSILPATNWNSVPSQTDRERETQVEVETKVEVETESPVSDIYIAQHDYRDSSHYRSIPLK